VEYAVLLGLLMLAMGAGAAWLGGSSTRSLSFLTGRMSGQPQATSPADNPSGDTVSSRPEGAGLEPMAGNRASILPAPWVFLALGTVMIGLGYVLLVRKRYRCEQQMLPEDDSEVLNLEERFCTKRQHLLRLLSQDPAILFKNQFAIRHLMTTDIISVSPGASRQRVAEVMREEHVRHLLVCGPGQKLLGIVSDRDLRSKPGKTAGELMSTQVKTVSPDMLISPATTHVLHEGISSLAVVEDGRLCGILTTTDLILALQCLLQLWLHTAVTIQSEIWEQRLLETVHSQLAAAGPDTCCGVQGVVEPLLGGQPAPQETAS
jgi:CBS domain-containing protein